MKIKVQIQILSNGLGKSDKSKEISKQIDIDENRDSVTFGEIISQFDEKLKRELDNRMVSYFHHASKVFIYIGNFWIERPPNTHKDVQDAK